MRQQRDLFASDSLGLTQSFEQQLLFLDASPQSECLFRSWILTTRNGDLLDLFQFQARTRGVFEQIAFFSFNKTLATILSPISGSIRSISSTDSGENLERNALGDQLDDLCDRKSAVLLGLLVTMRMMSRNRAQWQATETSRVASDA